MARPALRLGARDGFGSAIDPAEPGDFNEGNLPTMTTPMSIESADERAREARARRKAHGFGWAISRSRVRSPERPEYARYHIYDPYRNLAVAGFNPWAHSLTLDEVEVFLADDD